MTRLLLIDDDPMITEPLARQLGAAGYEVLVTHDGRSGLELAQTQKPDLVVLDVMMPELDGWEVCQKLRQNSVVPILMLTALGDEVDRILGLELGADDYLTKPFSMRELIARVKAQLRRTRLLREELGQNTEAAAHEVLAFDNLTINLTRREVTLNEAPLQLKPKEYELLLFLAEHRRQMLSREFILERVWGWGYIGDSRTVDVHVRWLRQKIEATPSEPKRIVTVRGGGYRFEG